MRSYLIFILIGLSSFLVRSQHFMPIQQDTSLHSFEAIGYGIADYGSTSIQNAFSQKLIFGGGINDEVKSSSFEKHDPINRFGVDLQAELEFRNYKSEKIGKGKYGWLVKGGYYNFAGLLYSQDLFGLAFYGNQRYLGESVDFSGTRASGWSYQKVGFGLVDKKTKSNISLNLYSVSAFGNANIRNGQLFQSIEGDSLNITYDGYAEYMRGSKMNRGWGLGIDADIRIPVQIVKDQTSYIQFLVKNFGVAYLPNITRYQADSTFTFEGLTFDQIFGDASIIDSTFSMLDTLNIKSETYSSIRFLPAFLQVGKIVDHQSTRKVQSFFGIRMYPSLVLVPQVFAGIHYHPLKWLSVGANTAFGGYTKFRFGIYTSFEIKQFNFGIATENIVGAVSLSGNGLSLVTRLRWML